VGGAIAAREALVWVPRLLAWSQETDSTPPAPQAPPVHKTESTSKYTV
jgi:hypothetical protein